MTDWSGIHPRQTLLMRYVVALRSAEWGEPWRPMRYAWTRDGAQRKARRLKRKFDHMRQWDLQRGVPLPRVRVAVFDMHEHPGRAQKN